MPWNAHQAESVTWPPLTTHSVDEYSPLLQKPSYDGIRNPYTDNDEVIRKSKREGLDSTSLFWIMSSIWIGTFTAGLGESERSRGFDAKILNPKRAVAKQY